MVDHSQRVGAGTLALSSATAAGLGWITLVVVARAYGPDSYAAFAVVWSFYYGFSGVLAGLQQEVTRSSAHPERISARAESPETAVGVQAIAVGVLASALASGSLGLWGSSVGASAAVVGALAVGLVGLSGLVVCLGLLAAQERWSLMATLLVLDAAMRLLAIGVATLGSAPLWVLTAALGGASWIWVPFLVKMKGTSSLANTLVARRRFVPRSLTLMASTGLASLLVAGLPWMVAVSHRGPVGVEVGGLLASLVLFRSPLLALMNGLRPVVLRGYLRNSEHLRRAVRLVWLRYTAAGIVISGTAWLAGPLALRAIFGPGFDVTRADAAALTASSMLLVMATHGALALVATDRHAQTVQGWGLGVLATIGVLAIPWEVETRVVVASLLGPIFVLAWQDRHLRECTERTTI